MMEIITKDSAKELLRYSIVNAINQGKEFSYLEQLAKNNHMHFDESIIDYCLDRYILLRREGENKFKSKYASMFITSWRILFDE